VSGERVASHNFVIAARRRLVPGLVAAAATAKAITPPTGDEVGQDIWHGVDAGQSIRQGLAADRRSEAPLTEFGFVTGSAHGIGFTNLFQSLLIELFSNADPPQFSDLVSAPCLNGPKGAPPCGRRR
jgi:hypothetical protein